MVCFGLPRSPNHVLGVSKSVSSGPAGGTAAALTERFALFQNFQLSWRCEFIRSYDMLLEDIL